MSAGIINEDIMTEFNKKGFNLSLENGKALLKVADLAVSENQFGIASSLNILAAEEIIKATLILMKDFLTEYDIFDFHKIFENHAVKHSLIKDHILLFDDFFKKDKEYLERNKQLYDIVEKLPPTVRNSFKENAKILYQTKSLTEEYNLSSEDISSAISWCEKANNLKNRGFYVDLKGSTWLSPSDFTKEQYEVEYRYTRTLLNWLEALQHILGTPGLKQFVKNNPDTTPTTPTHML